jgi:hypothetical protein
LPPSVLSDRHQSSVNSKPLETLKVGKERHPSGTSHRNI